MIKILSFLLSICIVTGCNQNLTIRDVVVTERLFSPDSSYIALTYYVDHGAMGETSSMTSILKVTDTIGLLNKSMLPCLDLPFNACYFPDHWLDNKTIQLYLHEIPFVKAGLPFDSAGIKVNGINCKVVPYDYSEGKSPLIDFIDFSEDRKKLLVAYRYNCDLNISVINYGDKLPKFGNIFTNTEIEFNPIVYAKWKGNEIDMFMRDAKMFETSNYINKNIPYKVQFVDINELGKLLNRHSCLSFSPLYDDKQVEDLLNHNGMKTSAIISDALFGKEDTSTSHYYDYQYQYEIAGQVYRSYFRKQQKSNKDFRYYSGDTIIIKYDPKQPFIHKLESNNSR